MNRQQLMQRLDGAWRDLQNSYDGLSNSQMTQPGVTQAWSVRDILAHVTSWDEEALKYLPVILRGGKPPRYSLAYGGIDAFNALTTERKKNHSLPEVLAEMHATHGRLVAYLESIPEEQFLRDTRFRRRLRLDTYAHYPKHTQAIRKWRARLGL